MTAVDVDVAEIEARAARRERERICLALEIAADRAQSCSTVEPTCDVLRDAAKIIRRATHLTVVHS